MYTTLYLATRTLLTKIAVTFYAALPLSYVAIGGDGRI